MVKCGEMVVTLHRSEVWSSGEVIPALLSIPSPTSAPLTLSMASCCHKLVAKGPIDVLSTEDKAHTFHWGLIACVLTNPVARAYPCNPKRKQNVSKNTSQNKRVKF